MKNLALHINLLYASFNEQASLMSVFAGIIITLVIGVFLFIIVKGLSTWTSNNAAEIVQLVCKVTDKRTQVSGGAGNSSASTNYYITFEFEDYTRLELRVKAEQFGLISVGDYGELVYQGTRFKSFNRIIK